MPGRESFVRPGEDVGLDGHSYLAVNPRESQMLRWLMPLTVVLVLFGTATATAAAAPAVSTSKADQISAESARLRGSVNPHGQPTTWYFEYGKTTSYGTRTASTDAGAANKGRAVTSTLTGLKPLTTYHFR